MKIHWFSVTLFASYELCLDLWHQYFSLELGQLVNTSRGGRGFQNIDVALHETKLYYNPVAQGDVVKEYCHFEFTGQSCDSVIPVHFRDFVHRLSDDGIIYSITRLDLAWDDLAFTPQEFYQFIHSGSVVTPAKRETLSLVQSPFELRDDGQEGCDTCYIGSKTSERFLRVYNKRGGTRLEFVCKGLRAHVVASDIFGYMYADWDIIARENLLDYIDFPSWSLWQDFIKFAQAADIVISPARKVALIKIEKWIERQVSVALSVFYDVHGWEVAQEKIDRMIFEAINSRDRSRYESILQLAPPFQNLRALQVPELHSLIDFDFQEL